MLLTLSSGTLLVWIWTRLTPGDVAEGALETDDRDAEEAIDEADDRVEVIDAADVEEVHTKSIVLHFLSSPRQGTYRASCSICMEHK